MTNNKNKKNSSPDASVEKNKTAATNDSSTNQTAKTEIDKSDNLEGETKNSSPDASNTSNSETENLDNKKKGSEDVSNNVYGVDTEYKSHPIDHTTDTSKFVFIGDRTEAEGFILEHGPKDNGKDDKSSETEFDKWKKEFNTEVDDRMKTKTVSEIFDTKSSHEAPPNPGTRQRIPGYTVPPPPRGGWHKVIDPVTSITSIITLDALTLLREQKAQLHYLGESDEKGNLLTK